MEAACLRIKFAPLIRTLYRNNIHESEAKCSIEIIPEVSCIHNFENIEWKRSQDKIEYTIPMTYKIRLQRQDNSNNLVDDNNEECNEIVNNYHSCVDILNGSSTISENHGCGDVNKIASENYFLTQFSRDIGYKFLVPMISFKKMEKYCKEDIDSARDSQSPSYLETMESKSVTCKNKGHENLDDLSQNLQSINDNHIMAVDDKCVQFDDFLASKLTQSAETSTRWIKKKMGDYNRPKLSLTPICLVNTVEDPSTTNDLTLNKNLFTCKCLTRKDIIGVKKNGTTCKVTTGECISDYIFDYSNIIGQTQRILPEIRVAHFVSIVKKELCPLQVMLNDIVQKFKLLNLYGYDNIMTHKLHRSITQRRIKCESSIIQKQAKSNRVVYSIIFDG